MRRSIATCAKIPMTNRDLETVVQVWRDLSDDFMLCRHYNDVGKRE